jgi:hypothetical protein
MEENLVRSSVFNKKASNPSFKNYKSKVQVDFYKIQQICKA